MAHQFKHHYTLEAARALLPQARQWLKQLQADQARFLQFDQRLRSLGQAGDDLGGQTVNDWTKLMVEMAALFAEFQRREIQIKDLDRGLLDFPSLKGDKEVFLCWELDEDDIHFWHELDAGFGGRERLE